MSFRIRKIYCGKKNCRCKKRGKPHAFYLYWKYKEKGKTKEKYLGVCDENGVVKSKKTLDFL